MKLVIQALLVSSLLAIACPVKAEVQISQSLRDQLQQQRQEESSERKLCDMAKANYQYYRRDSDAVEFRIWVNGERLIRIPWLTIAGEWAYSCKTDSRLGAVTTDYTKCTFDRLEGEFVQWSYNKEWVKVGDKLHFYEQTNTRSCVTGKVSKSAVTEIIYNPRLRTSKTKSNSYGELYRLLDDL